MGRGGVKILLLGQTPPLGQLASALTQQQAHQFTHHTESKQVIDELRQWGRRYDWVVFHPQSLEMEDTEVACNVREVGSLTRQGQGGSAQCRVEWSRNGTLYLHCQNNKFVQPKVRNESLVDVFEFYAPCGATNRRR